MALQITAALKSKHGFFEHRPETGCLIGRQMKGRSEIWHLYYHAAHWGQIHYLTEEQSVWPAPD